MECGECEEQDLIYLSAHDVKLQNLYRDAKLNVYNSDICLQLDDVRIYEEQCPYRKMNNYSSSFRSVRVVLVKPRGSEDQKFARSFNRPLLM